MNDGRGPSRCAAVFFQTRGQFGDIFVILCLDGATSLSITGAERPTPEEEPECTVVFG